MAVLNALKNRWLGPVAARVALERLRKRLKHCLGHVAARIASMGPVGSCESCLGKACGSLKPVGSCESCLGKACGRV